MTNDHHPDQDPAGVRLGFAVKVLGAGGLPSHDARRWQSGPHLRVSLERLRAILAYLDDIDVRCYRMATSLAPYASHPELVQFRDQPRECALEAKAKDLAVLRLRDQLTRRGFGWRDGALLAPAAAVEA